MRPLSKTSRLIEKLCQSYNRKRADSPERIKAKEAFLEQECKKLKLNLEGVKAILGVREY